MTSAGTILSDDLVNDTIYEGVCSGRGTWYPSGIPIIIFPAPGNDMKTIVAVNADLYLIFALRDPITGQLVIGETITDAAGAVVAYTTLAGGGLVSIPSANYSTSGLGNGYYSINILHATVSALTATSGQVTMRITTKNAACEDLGFMVGAVTVSGTVNVGSWNGTTVATPNTPGVPLVDVSLWGGIAPAAISTNGYVQSLVKRWVSDTAGGTPLALSTNGYVQSMLMRWLTDNAAGTPVALSTNGYLQTIVLRWLTDNAGGTPNALVNNDVPSDVKQWLGNVPAGLTTNGFVKTALLRWLTDDLAGTPNPLVAGDVPGAGGGGGGGGGGGTPALASIAKITCTVADIAPVIIGTRIRIEGTYTDTSGTAYAAAAVSLTVVTATTVSKYAMADLTNPSTGVFYRELIANESCTWFFLWSSTAAGEENYTSDEFQVLPIDGTFLKPTT